jgi:hypothetical protein
MRIAASKLSAEAIWRRVSGALRSSRTVGLSICSATLRTSVRMIR